MDVLQLFGQSFTIKEPDLVEHVVHRPMTHEARLERGGVTVGRRVGQLIAVALFPRQIAREGDSAKETFPQIFEWCAALIPGDQERDQILVDFGLQLELDG